MSELAGFGAGWLPLSVQRRMAVEDRAEAREARRAEAERQDRQEAAAERSLAAYRDAAEQRGEVVSAVGLATGQVVGRSLDDIFADARAAADREDAQSAARQRREDGDVVFIDREPVIHGASRSAWPSSEYQVDSLIARAGQLHRDFVAVRAKQDYPGAESAARAKSIGSR